jgi:hypothetical protein
MENIEIKLNLTKDEFNALWITALQNMEYWQKEVRENGEGNHNKEVCELATIVFNKIDKYNLDKPEKEVK